MQHTGYLPAVSCFSRKSVEKFLLLERSNPYEEFLQVFVVLPLFLAILCRNKKYTSDCFGESDANLGLCSGLCPDVCRNTGKKNRYLNLDISIFSICWSNQSVWSRISYFSSRVSVSIFFHLLLYILFIYEVIEPDAANIKLHYGELPRLKISCKPDGIIFCQRTWHFL